MTLPILLAGPVLRRAETSAVWIWVCTNGSVDVGAEVCSLDSPSALGSVVGVTEASQRVELSRSVCIHLIKVIPTGHGRFPHDEILGYRLTSGGGEWAAYEGVDYGVASYRFPTFVVQSPGRDALRAIFASCRKLHGEGRDASLGMLQYLERQADRALTRPTGLFLTGDQIYADDVSDVLFPRVVGIARELMPQELMRHEVLIDSGIDLFRIGSRRAIMELEAGFTSSAQRNHLIALGEYVALYLLAWNDRTWEREESWPSADTLYSDITDALRYEDVSELSWPSRDEVYETHRAEVDSLRDSRLGSAAMRKILANIPSYMIGDDHEVTDDWNLNPSWVRNVNRKALGRRVVGNGLVAYWAFQAWGNDPEVFDEEFVERIRAYVDPETSSQSRDDLFEYLNDGRRDLWSFRTPTKPVAVFLDLRTQRTAAQNTAIVDEVYSGSRLRGVSRMRETRLPSGLRNSGVNGMAPRLMNARALTRARQLLGRSAGQSLLLVLPAPVIGASVVDFAQDRGTFFNGSFHYDFEGWRSDPESLLGLYEVLHEVMPRYCAILSGDVHYGFAYTGSISWRDNQSMNIGQFTSSAIKNASSFTSAVIALGDAILWEGRSVRWYYEGSPEDRVGKPTGRVVFDSEVEMRRAGRGHELREIGPRVIRPPLMYCEESWRRISVAAIEGFIAESNFGVLIASDADLRVRMFDAAGVALGALGVLQPTTSEVRRQPVRRDSPGQARVTQFRELTVEERWLARDLARLCADAYRPPYLSGVDPAWTVVQTDVVIDGIAIVEIANFSDTASGFDARLYVNPDRSVYVLCFKGSDPSTGDWWANFEQLVVGYARQYELAMNLAQQFARIPESRLLLTGYSLGGGLAAAGGLVTGLETWTFNAAGLHSRTLANREDYALLLPNARRISAVFLDGEFLSAIQDGEVRPPIGWELPSAPGLRISVPTELTGDPRRHDPLGQLQILPTRLALHLPAALLANIGREAGLFPPHSLLQLGQGTVAPR